MSHHDEGANDVKKLAGLIKDIKFAMFTTVEEDGTLRSRPMGTQETEFDGDLWFFTQASAPKVGEVEHDQHVNVSYSKPEDQKYISVSGMARLVRDKAKEKELWNPVFKVWFPKGLEDPDLALLKVSVTHAEYWEAPSNTFVRMAGFAKALIGDRSNLGEHGSIDLEKR